MNRLRTILVLAIALAAAARTMVRAGTVTAIPVSDFLNSVGTQSAISVRGESFAKTVECAKYLGARWFRAGIEGDVPVSQLLELHEQAGLRFSWGLGSGGTNIAKLIETGKQLAAGGALLAFEGPNEPNNWGITYDGEAGGRDQSWIPIARLQRDLYRAVKSTPELRNYPVWSISENGAETDNVGMQFLTIPAGAQTAMPPETKYADYANVHNYIYHPNAPGLEDNKTWKAAEPGPACKVDGLFGEYGVTWAHHYPGYSEKDLQTLPRVTTETGETIGGAITEEIHGLNLLSLFLDQFKRGWSYTCVYLMRDRVDEGGNQQFGFFRPNYTPRKAGIYLHNLTTILADDGKLAKPGVLSYVIAGETPIVHDMLLQKSNGAFDLVIWGEMLKGEANVGINLGRDYDVVKIYDPTIGTQPSTLRGKISSLTLPLGDHPLIIELQQPQ